MLGTHDTFTFGAPRLDCVVDGIEIYLADCVLDAMFGDAWSAGTVPWDATCEAMQKAQGALDAHGYARPSDGFSLLEAAAEAKKAGRPACIVEDLS